MATPLSPVTDSDRSVTDDFGRGHCRNSALTSGNAETVTDSDRFSTTGSYTCACVCAGGDSCRIGHFGHCLDESRSQTTDTRTDIGHCTPLDAR